MSEQEKLSEKPKEEETTVEKKQEETKEKPKEEEKTAEKIQEDQKENIECCFIGDIQTNIKIISDKEQYGEIKINQNLNCFIVDIIEDDKNKIIGLIFITKKDRCFLLLKPDFKCTEFEQIKKILENKKAIFACDDESAANLLKKANLKIEPNYLIFQIPDEFDDVEEFLKDQKVDLHVINDTIDAEDDYDFLTTNVEYHCQDAIFAFHAAIKTKLIEFTEQQLNEKKIKQQERKQKQQNRNSNNKSENENQRRSTRQNKKETHERKRVVQEINIEMGDNKKQQKYSQPRENRDNQRQKPPIHKRVEINDLSNYLKKETEYKKALFIRKTDKKGEKVKKQVVFNIMEKIKISDFQSAEIDGTEFFVIPINQYVELDDLKNSDNIWFLVDTSK